MADIVFELNGFLDDSEGRKPLYVRIAAPYPAHGELDFACRVPAPLIFREDKFIYGVDTDQAVALAIQFVRTLLNGKNVTDANGQPIRW